MLLQRALDLCQLPVDQSKSHQIKVDRFAMIHVLADRKERLDIIARLEAKIAALEGENELLADKLAAAEKDLLLAMTVKKVAE